MGLDFEQKFPVLNTLKTLLFPEEEPVLTPEFKKAAQELGVEELHARMKSFQAGETIQIGEKTYTKIR